MEIPDIKSKLTLSQVLHYYHLKPDKNLRLVCPFHADKTPSMQVYYKTHTAYCFSTNCKTNGQSLDVIDFIMHKESITKHEAILKAKEMIGGGATFTSNVTRTALEERADLLGRMFTYFKNGVHNSKPAKEYLKKRGLSHEKTEVGYNSGQFHHGTRKDEALIKSCVEYGLLLDLGTKARTGNPAYKSFGKSGIVFPLRNCQGQIVSLYFRSIYENKNQKHFYLRDRQGLYPGYPKAETNKLILTESVIDAVTLLEQPKIKSKYELLAMYGTNGLTKEHIEVIKNLKELSEIIFFLDGDDSGCKAVAKYAPILKSDFLTEQSRSVKISNVATPNNEDVNSLLQSHSPEILTHLIETRKPYDLILSRSSAQVFSNEKPIEKEKESIGLVPIKVEKEVVKSQPTLSQSPQLRAHSFLDTSNPYNLKYAGSAATYLIKGFRSNQPDSLKVTLNIHIK